MLHDTCKIRDIDSRNNVTYLQRMGKRISTGGGKCIDNGTWKLTTVSLDSDNRKPSHRCSTYHLQRNFHQGGLAQEQMPWSELGTAKTCVSIKGRVPALNDRERLGP